MMGRFSLNAITMTLCLAVMAIVLLIIGSAGAFSSCFGVRRSLPSGRTPVLLRMVASPVLYQNDTTSTASTTQPRLPPVPPEHVTARSTHRIMAPEEVKEDFAWLLEDQWTDESRISEGLFFANMVEEPILIKQPPVADTHHQTKKQVSYHGDALLDQPSVEAISSSHAALEVDTVASKPSVDNIDKEKTLLSHTDATPSLNFQATAEHTTVSTLTTATRNQQPPELEKFIDEAAKGAQQFMDVVGFLAKQSVEMAQSLDMEEMMQRIEEMKQDVISQIEEERWSKITKGGQGVMKLGMGILQGSVALLKRVRLPKQQQPNPSPLPKMSATLPITHHSKPSQQLQHPSSKRESDGVSSARPTKTVVHRPTISLSPPEAFRVWGYDGGHLATGQSTKDVIFASDRKPIQVVESMHAAPSDIHLDQAKQHMEPRRLKPVKEAKTFSAEETMTSAYAKNYSTSTAVIHSKHEHAHTHTDTPFFFANYN